MQLSHVGIVCLQKWINRKFPAIFRRRKSYLNVKKMKYVCGTSWYVGEESTTYYYLSHSLCAILWKNIRVRIIRMRKFSESRKEEWQGDLRQGTLRWNRFVCLVRTIILLLYLNPCERFIAGVKKPINISGPCYLFHKTWAWQDVHIPYYMPFQLSLFFVLRK